MTNLQASKRASHSLPYDKQPSQVATRFPPEESWWTTSIGRRWTRALLIVIILLGAGLRFYQLDLNSLWVDEIITENLAKTRLSVLPEFVRQYDVHPPLFYILASLTRRAVGSSDFGARFLAAFAGVLCIPTMFVLARRLQGNLAGLLASLLLATMPFYLLYSQEARSYTLAILLQIASMYWLYRGLHEGRARAWLWYTLTMIAGLYVHYFAFLWLAAQGVFVALIGLTILLRRGLPQRGTRLRRAILPFVASLSVCGLAYLPWYKTLLSHTQIFTNPARLPGGISVSRLLDIRILIPIWQTFADNQSVLATVLLVAAVAGFIVGIIQRKWVAMAYVALGFLVPALAVELTSSASYFQPRYGFSLLAPAVLFAAGGFTLPYQIARTAFRRIPLPTVVSLLFLGVVAFMIPFDAASYRIWKEDWRGAANYIAAHQAPGDVIIGDGVFGDGGGGDALRVEQGLGYYLHNPALVIKADSGLVDRLPPDQSTIGTAWGVIWYQGQLNDRSLLDNTLDFMDYYSVVMFRLKRPSGSVWSDTTTILEAMLKLQPLPETHLDLHLALVELYAETGDMNLAARHTDAALALLPKDDDRRETILAQTSRFRQLAEMKQAQKTGDLEATRSLYAKALAAEQNPASRFDITMEWAIFERFHANPQAAIDLLEQALTLRPDDIEAHANYGAVLLDADRLEDAIREFRLVITRRPDHYWAYYFIGIAYQRSSRLTEALAAWEKAAQLPVDDATRAGAVSLAADAAMQMKDCTRVRGIAQKYAVVLVPQKEAVAQFLSQCP